MSTRRWIFATDGSNDALAAQRFLAKLKLGPDFEVHVVTVVADRAPLLGPYMEGVYANWQVLEQVRRSEQEAAQRILSNAADALSARGASMETSQRTGDPPHEILALAQEIGAECIVVGCKGLSGLEGFLLGSVARNVAKHADRPVLVAKDPVHGLQKIIVATDGSEFSQHATRFAAALPLPDTAEVIAANVIRLYDPFPGVFPTDREDFRQAVEEVRAKQQETAKRHIEAAVAVLSASLPNVTSATHTGDAADELIRMVHHEKVDLLVMGARGISAIERLLVGSVADRLLKAVPCSLLISH